MMLLSISIRALLSAPNWTNRRKMQKILHVEPAGNTLTFRCNAVGEPPLTGKWYKNGELISKDKRIGGYKVGIFFYVMKC